MNKKSITFIITLMIALALITFIGTRLIGFHNLYLLTPGAEVFIVLIFITASLYFNPKEKSETPKNK